MNPTQIKMIAFFALAFLLLQLLAAPPSAVQGQPAEESAQPATAWMIELEGPPAVAVYAAQQAALAAAASSPAGSEPGTASSAAAAYANASATASAQAQLAQITAAQAAMEQHLAAQEIPLLFSVQRVYNGLAVLATAEQGEALAQLPGVAAVHPMRPKFPDNDVTVPYLDIPDIWQGVELDSAPNGLRGEGVRVAVIDTGIDYLHRDFGGPGSGYERNDQKLIGDVAGFPNARVVGGYDFVGDGYDAGTPSTIRPDPDPMDCYGHGTHVAGTLAGSGVTADRSTFAGPYDTNIDFSGLEIGPGVAPRADIYALKIFGCSGGTLVTDLALEWAVDPNRDGDFADRMDVVNMSLGSPYGMVYDTSAVAANNAALAGVIVVASAGNSGDTQLIVGAPSIADRVISVAASPRTAAAVTSFSSRGPRRGDAVLKPDITAPGASIYSAANGSGWRGTTNSGTSMAAPHVSGMMALLRQAHPSWSVEELKAVAMNTATPLTRSNFFAGIAREIPLRSGAGLIDPLNAVQSTILAYAADGSGRVSVSFGAPEVSTFYTATQQIAITNKATTDIWLQLAYESTAQLPGVQVHTPAAALLVPALSTIQAPVTVVVDAAELKRLRAGADATLTADPWFAEESGYLSLQPTGTLTTTLTTPPISLPLYFAPRPLAAMEATTTTLQFDQQLEQTINLAGSGLSGSAPPTDVVSLASVLELRLRSPNTRPQGLDPNAADIYDHADLQYVGVTADSTGANGDGGENVSEATISFGITTWEPWSTPNEISVNVFIDTDLDGEDDYRLYNFDASFYGGLWYGPSYISRLTDLRTYTSAPQGPLNGASPALYDTGIFFRRALVLPVRAGDLGLSAERSRFAFRIETWSIDVASDRRISRIDRTPRLYFDVRQPALQFSLPGGMNPLVRDEALTTIGVRLDPAGQVQTPASGVLILHHHNASREPASLVTFDYRPPFNLYMPAIRR